MQKTLTKKYGTPTENIPITTEQDFKDAWKKIAESKDVDEVALIFHGDKGMMWAFSGQGDKFMLSSLNNGKSTRGSKEVGISVQSLEQIDAELISLYSCYSAVWYGSQNSSDQISLQDAFLTKNTGNVGAIWGYTKFDDKTYEFDGTTGSMGSKFKFMVRTFSFQKDEMIIKTLNKKGSK